MIVDIIGPVIEFIEIVDGAAVTGHRGNGFLDHVLGFVHRHAAGLAGFIKDAAGFLYHTFIFLDEGVAAVENAGGRLIIFAQLVLVLNVDDSNIQEVKPCNMCLR